MHNSRECGYTLILLLVSTVTSAQAGEEFRTLVINDLSGKVVVMEVGGKNLHRHSSPSLIFSLLLLLK